MTATDSDVIREIFENKYPSDYPDEWYVSPSLSSSLRSTYYDVEDLDRKSIMDKVDMMITKCSVDISSSKKHKGEFRIPKKHQEYRPSHQRILMKKGAKTVRNISKENTVMRVLLLIYDLCNSDSYCNKRELLYQYQKFFGKQQKTDAILDDLAIMLDCQRNSLRVLAEQTGCICGDLTFTVHYRSKNKCSSLVLNTSEYFEWTDKLKKITEDCSQRPVTIPSNINFVENMSTKSSFVLLVQSCSIFEQLYRVNFHEEFNCLLMTWKGYPDVGVRNFLQRLKAEFKLPVLALTDCDYDGIKIMSAYRYGSKSMAYMNLATPDVKWLGIRPSDLDRFNVPSHLRDQLDSRNEKKVICLKNEDFIKDNAEWTKELEWMLEKKETAKIESLFYFTDSGEDSGEDPGFTIKHLVTKLKGLDIL